MIGKKSSDFGSSLRHSIQFNYLIDCFLSFVIQCLCYDLKICILLAYNSQIILSLYLQVQLSHFSFKVISIVDTLCVQLLLKFYADCFETFTDALVMV